VPNITKGGCLKSRFTPNWLRRALFPLKETSQSAVIGVSKSPLQGGGGKRIETTSNITKEHGLQIRASKILDLNAFALGPKIFLIV